MSDWTFLNESQPVARKSHKCILCGEMITKGEKHIARRGITYDDGPVTSRMHFACEKITQSWDEMDWETGWDQAEFRHLLQLDRDAVAKQPLT